MEVYRVLASIEEYDDGTQDYREVSEPNLVLEAKTAEDATEFVAKMGEIGDGMGASDAKSDDGADDPKGYVVSIHVTGYDEEGDYGDADYIADVGQFEGSDAKEQATGLAERLGKMAKL